MQNGTLTSADVGGKKLIKHNIYTGDYVWNSKIWVYKLNKIWLINEYSFKCTCMKNVSVLMITCEYEMVNTSTNSFDNKVTYELNYFFLYTISLVPMCLLLLIINAINCYYTKLQSKNENGNI